MLLDVLVGMWHRPRAFALEAATGITWDVLADIVSKFPKRFHKSYLQTLELGQALEQAAQRSDGITAPEVFKKCIIVAHNCGCEGPGNVGLIVGLYDFRSLF